MFGHVNETKPPSISLLAHRLINVKHLLANFYLPQGTGQAQLMSNRAMEGIVEASVTSQIYKLLLLNF